MSIIHIIGVVPAIFGGDKESSLRASLKWFRIREVNTTIMTWASNTATNPISFTEKDQPGVDNHYKNTIVINLLIANYYIGSILIDTKSLANIIS